MKKQISILLLGLLCVFSSYSQDTLQAVKVISKNKGLQKSSKITANTTLVTSKELLKAACCNLAESFETNPSIDVNFADALTGTKQIKMLGLTSPYLMIAEENIPQFVVLHKLMDCHLHQELGLKVFRSQKERVVLSMDTKVFQGKSIPNYSNL